jgi:hypothetical protein
MIIGADGNAVSTGGLKSKKPIVELRVVVFKKMIVHPHTKEMVMVPMQDYQYQREGSDEWFSMDGLEVENHEPNLENSKSG